MCRLDILLFSDKDKKPLNAPYHSSFPFLMLVNLIETTLMFMKSRGTDVNPCGKDNLSWAIWVLKGLIHLGRKSCFIPCRGDDSAFKLV